MRIYIYVYMYNYTVYIHDYTCMYSFSDIYNIYKPHAAKKCHDHTNHTDTSRKPLNNIVWTTCNQ